MNTMHPDFIFNPPFKTDVQHPTEPYLSALQRQTLSDHNGTSKLIDDEQFTAALERCFRKSIYDDYSCLPRWALWS